MRTVLSVFGINPFRIGGQEAFARELSLQLGVSGWNSVLCFTAEPRDKVREYLQLPNVSFEVLEAPEKISWKSTRDLARIVRRHRPHLLHLHYTPFVGPYPWVARLLSVPRIFFTDHSSRGVEEWPKRAATWKRFVARAINFPLSGVVCVSRFGQECLAKLDLLSSSRLKLVYNGVELTRATAEQKRAALFRNKYSIPQSRRIVLQVSWIIPEKGIADLLEAAAQVLERNRAAQFVFVGEGSYRSQYADLASRMGLGDHVTWTGLVEDPFAEGVFSAADIVCQVSRWQEVFGFAIAEAMAWRKPVVATRIGGIPELVHDGENGFLVARGAADQIAEKILVLLHDPALRERMGCRGREFAEREFDLRQTVGQLIRLYGVTAN